MSAIVTTDSLVVCKFRLEKLERENAALRADKERLDWLEQSTFYPISATGESVRVAIDAARKEQP